MLKKIILLFIAFLYTVPFWGQNSIEISGIVTDSLGVVKNAHIINLQTNIGAFSKDDGSFTLPVKLGDSLKISSVQHKTDFVIIGGFSIKTKRINIFLQNLIYELDEFELKKHNLLGILGIDQKNVPTDKRDSILRKNMDLSKVDMRVVEEDDYIDKRVRPNMVRTDPNLGFVGAGTSIGIAWKHSEKYWALLRELAHKESLPGKLLSDLGGKFFFEDLKIPVERYYHFLEYCNPLGIEDLYKEGKLIEVIKILEQENTGYLKIIEEE